MPLSPSHAAATAAYFEAAFAPQPIMGIFRDLTPDGTVAAVTNAWAAGITHVEVPVSSESGWDALDAVLAVAGERHVGIGTVLTPDQVERAAAAGARFCVSPGFDTQVALACESTGLFHLPGVATATEISTALLWEYRWLKAFPASVLGSAWITAMRGPFPQVAFVCTGGMSRESWPEYSAAGARGIAIGRGFTG